MKVADIKKDLQKKLVKTINSISTQATKIMNQEVGSFYVGEPTFYQRTGKLKSTPQVTEVYVAGNSAGLTAGLNDNIEYETGSFTGKQVVTAAETGAAGIVGQGGFWERSETRIKKAVDDEVKKNF